MDSPTVDNMAAVVSPRQKSPRYSRHCKEVTDIQPGFKRKLWKDDVSESVKLPGRKIRRRNSSPTVDEMAEFPDNNNSESTVSRTDGRYAGGSNIGSKKTALPIVQKQKGYKSNRNITCSNSAVAAEQSIEESVHLVRSPKTGCAVLKSKPETPGSSNVDLCGQFDRPYPYLSPKEKQSILLRTNSPTTGKNNLHSHSDTCSSNESSPKSYTCKWCSFTTSRINILLLHQKNVHISPEKSNLATDNSSVREIITNSCTSSKSGHDLSKNSCRTLQDATNVESELTQTGSKPEIKRSRPRREAAELASVRNMVTYETDHLDKLFREDNTQASGSCSGAIPMQPRGKSRGRPRKQSVKSTKSGEMLKSTKSCDRKNGRGRGRGRRKARSTSHYVEFPSLDSSGESQPQGNDMLGHHVHVDEDDPNIESPQSYNHHNSVMNNSRTNVPTNENGSDNKSPQSEKAEISVGDDIFDEDDDLPDVLSFSQQSNLGLLAVGDLVWVKHHFPFWPAVVKRVYLKKKKKITKLSIGLISSVPEHRLSFRLNFNEKNIIKFGGDCDEHQRLLNEGRVSKFRHEIEEAVSMAQDFLIQSHRDNLDQSSLQFFGYQKVDDEDSIDSESDSSVAMSCDNISLSTVNEGQEILGSDDNQDSPDKVSAKQRACSNLRLQKGAKLIEVCKSDMMKEYIKNVYTGVQPSKLHDLFHKPKKTKEEMKLLNYTTFGIIDDEDQQNEVLKILTRHFDRVRETPMETYKERLPMVTCKEMGYLSFVIIPEAIIYAIQVGLRRTRAAAEAMFKSGILYTKEEVEQEKQDLNTPLTEEQRDSAQRRLALLAEKNGIRLK